MSKLAASKCRSVPPSPTTTARRFHGLPAPSSLLWKKSELVSKLHGVHSQKNWLKLPSDGGCGSLAPTGRMPQLRSRGIPTDGYSRSEEHTSELQSLMRISYAVFCLKKNKINTNRSDNQTH